MGDQNSKAAFAWDYEEGIGMYDVSDKERHTVSHCTLNGKQYIVDTKMVLMQKTGWTPKKNTSIPLDNMEQLVKIFEKWKGAAE